MYFCGIRMLEHRGGYHVTKEEIPSSLAFELGGFFGSVSSTCSVGEEKGAADRWVLPSSHRGRQEVPFL